MPRSRSRGRRITAATVLPLALLMAAGCTGPGGGTSPSRSTAAADSISADIEAQLSERDDVSSVDVYYQDTVTVPESASVDITMKAGADPQLLSDEAVRLVWGSRLDPLSTIDVSVIDPVEPTNGVSTSINLLDDGQRESLEREYGPHPR